MRSVGKELGVTHILEGSVRKADGRIRITAQLIQVATGYHAWSETYDREMADVFSIRDEIATTVAAKLGPTLGVVPSGADFGCDGVEIAFGTAVVTYRQSPGGIPTLTHVGPLDP